MTEEYRNRVPSAHGTAPQKRSNCTDRNPGFPSWEGGDSSARQGFPPPDAFWASLHHRAVDRVAEPWLRGWLHAHSHLRPIEHHGWPVLQLVLVIQPGLPLEGGWSEHMVLSHYKAALGQQAKRGGPLGDLAAATQVVVEVQR